MRAFSFIAQLCCTLNSVGCLLPPVAADPDPVQWRAESPSPTTATPALDVPSTAQVATATSVGHVGSSQASAGTMDSIAGEGGHMAHATSAPLAGASASTQTAGAGGSDVARRSDEDQRSTTCAVDNGDCDTQPMAACTQVDQASTHCACPSFYEGDGHGAIGCQPVDQCGTANGGCDTSPMAKCRDYQGEARTCGCPADFFGDGQGMDGCSPTAKKTHGSYTVGDMTVLDTGTQLTWQRLLPETYEGCTFKLSQAQSAGAACNLEEASRYCAHLSLDGSGWRVPTLAELQSVVDKSQTPSAIDPSAFPNTRADNFWSVSEDETGATWMVSFAVSGGTLGGTDSLRFGALVRCVRSSASSSPGKSP